MELENPYIVYIRTNSDGYITAVNSSAFLNNLTGWEEIDSGHGDRYHHAQNNYFPDAIMTENDAYRYKLIAGEAVECTADEIAAQEEANKPKVIAPRNILAGEYVTINGVLYKATANIPNGERIITGHNAIETTIEQQLAELAKGE